MDELKAVVKGVLFGRPDGFRASLRRRWAASQSDAAGEVKARPVPVPAPAAPDGFHRALSASSLAPGEVVEVMIGEQHLALCNVGGVFHASSNVCPHAGGPIGEGTLVDHALTCPYHGWAFDVRDGSCAVNAEVKLPIYPVKLVDGVVYVKLV